MAEDRHQRKADFGQQQEAAWTPVGGLHRAGPPSSGNQGGQATGQYQMEGYAVAQSAKKQE